MRRRRRGFGSTESEHKSMADVWHSSLEQNIAEAEDALRIGRCDIAMGHLCGAEHDKGALFCHRSKSFSVTEARQITERIMRLRRAVNGCYRGGK